MANIYTLARIVATASTKLRFIWNDGYEELHGPEWTGYFRGSIGGYDANGEYERRDGTGYFGDDPVLDVFLAIQGNAVEPYVPPAERVG